MAREAKIMRHGRNWEVLDGTAVVASNLSREDACLFAAAYELRRLLRDSVRVIHCLSPKGENPLSPRFGCTCPACSIVRDSQTALEAARGDR